MANRDRLRDFACQMAESMDRVERPTDAQRTAMLADLLTVWRKHPDQRLGQLFTNIANAPGNDPFYIKDDEMARKIKGYL